MLDKGRYNRLFFCISFLCFLCLLFSLRRTKPFQSFREKCYPLLPPTMAVKNLETRWSSFFSLLLPVVARRLDCFGEEEEDGRREEEAVQQKHVVVCVVRCKLETLPLTETRASAASEKWQKNSQNRAQKHTQKKWPHHVSRRGLRAVFLREK